MGSSTRAAVLCGLGSWLPPDVVTNTQLEQVLDTTDEWIRKRTGVVNRHVARPGVPTSELAVEAGQRALKSAGAGPGTIDAVILATTTPDRPCPATAPEVASRLGLGTIAAFDIAAVCTGFIYALATATGLITAGIAGQVLVIGAEVFTSILNPGDRTTRAIFGDGAGAVVLRAGTADELGAIGPFVLGSDGAGAELIMVPAGGSRQPSSAGPDQYFTMAGQPVYRQAVDIMTKASAHVLQLAGWPVETVDWLVCHQANVRILNAVAGRLGVAADKCYVNIDQVGNTAAASIPLALSQGAEAAAFRPGDRMMLTAFGGGLTWGSTVLRWPEVVAEN